MHMREIYSKCAKGGGIQSRETFLCSCFLTLDDDVIWAFGVVAVLAIAVGLILTSSAQCSKCGVFFSAGVFHYILHDF